LSHARFYADDVERRKWQNPDGILAEIGLRKNMTFVDIGCGGGFFAIPAAQLVGKRGKVLAVDIDAQAIEELKAEADEKGLTNVVTRVGSAEQTVFCESCADIAFFGIVLHDFQDASKVLRNAKTMLKPNGVLVDLDWKKTAMQFGPPLSIRFSEAQATNLLEKARFEIEEKTESGPFHYLIKARSK